MTKLVSLTCFSFLIILQIITASSALKSKDLIEKTCESLPSYNRALNPTEYRGFCVKYLKSDPKSSNATNVKELAEIVLNMVSTKANETEVYSYDLSNNTTDQMYQRFFATCTMSLSDIYEERVPGAFAALNSSDYNAAIALANDCCSDAYLCRNQFADDQPILTQDCNVVHDLALMAYDIIGLVEHN